MLPSRIPNFTVSDAAERDLESEWAEEDSGNFWRIVCLKSNFILMMHINVFVSASVCDLLCTVIS